MSDDEMRVLGQIEGKLDLLLETFSSHVKQDQTMHAALDLRIDAISAETNRARGGRRMLVLITGVVVAAFDHGSAKLLDLLK